MGGGPVATPECLSRRRRPDLPHREGRKAPQIPRPDLSFSVAAEALLAGSKWQRVSGVAGTKGRLTCLFAACRIRVADGHKHRMLDNRVQCMPGDEVWLVGERRSTGEQKHYASNLPADTSLKMLAATIKARWVCEQAHQQLKEQLGLDHFEGRSWTGLHRHALMTMIAYAFLQSRRLKAADGKKELEDHRHNRACRPSGKPSSYLLPHARHPGSALTVRSSSPKNCQSSASALNSYGRCRQSFELGKD